MSCWFVAGGCGWHESWVVVEGMDISPSGPFVLHNNNDVHKYWLGRWCIWPFTDVLSALWIFLRLFFFPPPPPTRSYTVQQSVYTHRHIYDDDGAFTTLIYVALCVQVHRLTMPDLIDHVILCIKLVLPNLPPPHYLETLPAIIPSSFFCPSLLCTWWNEIARPCEKNWMFSPCYNNHSCTGVAPMSAQTLRPTVHSKPVLSRTWYNCH